MRNQPYTKWSERQAQRIARRVTRDVAERESEPKPPEDSLWFLHRQSHGMLRRYFYTKLQTARVGSVLHYSASGWLNTRDVRQFEDALIFVHDMEKCIERLPWLAREILTRHVIFEYTQAEAAAQLGLSERAFNYKFLAALDLLTVRLINAELLILPEHLTQTLK